jgi:hypothetical protein
MKFGRQVIEGELDAIIFNPTFPIILLVKWLGFRFVSWRHGFQLCTEMVWDC